MPRAVKSALQRLRTPISRLRRRLARQNAAKKAALWAPFPLFSSFALLLGHRFLPKQTSTALPFGLGFCLLAVGVALFVVLRATFTRLPDRELTLRIDRTLGNTDRLTNAVYFAQRKPESLGLLEQTVIEQGLAVIESIDLDRVAPFRRPTLFPCITLFLAHLVVFFLPVDSPRTRPVAVPLVPPTTVEWSIPRDDLSALEESLARLKPLISSRELAESSLALESLLRELRQRRITQEEAFERLANQSERLSRIPPADAMLAAEAFQEVGSGLRNHPTTSALFSALGQGHTKDAKAALASLKARFSDPRRAPTKAELDHLRSALEQEKQALAKQREQYAAEVNTLADEQRSLLSRKANGTTSAKELTRHQELDRRLQTLDRKREANHRVNRILSALDRALADAAADLNRKLTESSNPFSKLSEELDEQLAAELTDAQKQRLLEELRALEETISKYGQGQELKRADLERYGERAQGDRHARDARSTAGAEPSSLRAAPNPSGSAVIIGLGLSKTTGATPTTDGASQTGATQGRSLGIVHDEQVRGQTETKRLSAENDTTAVTAETSNETVSAEVVARAAERGFTQPNYAQIYRAYEPVRESLLERPDVPQAKRGQVRRYFQLIRPRDTPP